MNCAAGSTTSTGTSSNCWRSAFRSLRPSARKKLPGQLLQSTPAANGKSLIAAAGGMTADEITEIYRSVIKLARERQEVSVAFQGEAGAYSEEAALTYFGQRAVTKPCESLEDVFKDVEGGGVQFGMIPIENSIEGSISRSYDLMLESLPHRESRIYLGWHQTRLLSPAGLRPNRAFSSSTPF
jgi:hypothetical protein